MFVFQMFEFEVFVFEDLVAEVTRVLLMYLHVPGELATLGRGVGAQPAVVRLFSRVRPPMHRKV